MHEGEMRLVSVLFLLSLGAVRAEDDPLATEERIWRGTIEIVSISREPPEGTGREEQRERIEFRLASRPADRKSAFEAVPFRMIETKGAWSLSIDTRDGDGDKGVVRQGDATGTLHGTVTGAIDPRTGKYRIAVDASPESLVVKTTMSGKFQGRFTTWRTVLDRAPLLDGFVETGEAADGNTRITGSKTLVDRRVWLPRDVTVTWSIERIDPVVRGRITDHHGAPLAGIAVIARCTTAARTRAGLPPEIRQGTTGDDGRFRLQAHWGFWRVEVLGLERDGVVVEKAILKQGVPLSLENVPDLAIRLKAFDLAKLPRAGLLRQHFLGNVGDFLAWLRERYPETRLDAALRLPPAE
jgi:hypothetical protein